MLTVRPVSPRPQCKVIRNFVTGSKRVYAPEPFRPSSAHERESDTEATFTPFRLHEDQHKDMAERLQTIEECDYFLALVAKRKSELKAADAKEPVRETKEEETNKTQASKNKPVQILECDLWDDMPSRELSDFDKETIVQRAQMDEAARLGIDMT